ncbi:hypothetical protein FQN50_009972, partial [Emmonsiellopsis sp. PD_5]
NLALKHGKRWAGTPQGNLWWNPTVAEAVKTYKDILNHLDRHSEEEEIAACWVCNREVRLAKAAGFRGLLDSAREDPQVLWRMAKWGRNSSGTPLKPPRVLALKLPVGACAKLNWDPNYITTTTGDKDCLLQWQFFPPDKPVGTEGIRLVEQFAALGSGLGEHFTANRGGNQAAGALDQESATGDPERLTVTLEEALQVI